MLIVEPKLFLVALTRKALARIERIVAPGAFLFETQPLFVCQPGSRLDRLGVVKALLREPIAVFGVVTTVVVALFIRLASHLFFDASWYASLLTHSVTTWAYRRRIIPRRVVRRPALPAQRLVDRNGKVAPQRHELPRQFQPLLAVDERPLGHLVGAHVSPQVDAGVLCGRNHLIEKAEPR